MLNTQRPEPATAGDGQRLDVVEIFYTIQGEGPFSGRTSVFIRLAGCNLQCPLCDTQYTEGRQMLSVLSIAAKVSELLKPHPRTNLVVITGGEPTRQNIAPLIWELIGNMGLTVQIESNGVLPLSAELDPAIIARQLYFIISPKTSRIHPDNADRAHAFKYVLSHDDLDNDGLPKRALGHKAAPCVARPPLFWRGDIYVNPCDDKDPVRNRANMLACRDSALKHGYVLGVQLHKIVDVP